MLSANLRRALLVGIALTSLTGCNTFSRLVNVGGTPELSAISNPVEQRDYRPVSLPMPAVNTVPKQANSLWRAGEKSFFKDQRASRVGDILTVMISVNDEATLENESTRSRLNNTESLSIPSLFGFQTHLDRALPRAADPTGNLYEAESNLSNAGKGKVDRSEVINLKVAAVVTQILPNGNMVIRGQQEISVNFEMRELTVAGIIRPEDISSSNVIDYEKIAEARIAYGGRGTISDVQQPRYGSQLMDILLPF